MAEESEAACSSENDLAEDVRKISEYFDKLVDSIHPKFYIPVEDTIDKPWAFGMSKKQKQESKRKAKENLKKARRDRLDPEKQKTTSQLLQKQSSEAETQGEALNQETAEVENGELAPVDRVRSSLELQARLHKRIEAIRAERLVNKARDWQNKTKDASKKRKKSEEAAPKKETVSNKRQKQIDEEPVIDMEFGRVKIDSQKRPQPNRRNKEKLLEQATKLQEDLLDPEKGTELASKHAWNAAVSRASGEKVLDNPKLLKQSLKKDQQRREKSAQKWQGRQNTEAQRAEEKQQARSSHIKEKNDARKQRHAAKREKKLMRPGFEGRKTGFLNAK